MYYISEPRCCTLEHYKLTILSKNFFLKKSEAITDNSNAENLVYWQ